MCFIMVLISLFLSPERCDVLLQSGDLSGDPAASAVAVFAGPHLHAALFGNKIIDIGSGNLVFFQSKPKSLTLPSRFQCESIAELRLQPFGANASDRPFKNFPSAARRCVVPS